MRLERNPHGASVHILYQIWPSSELKFYDDFNFKGKSLTLVLILYPMWPSSELKFYDDLNTYEKRCFKEDPIGAKIVFPEAEEEIVDLDIYLSELSSGQDTAYITRLPVDKHVQHW